MATSPGVRVLDVPKDASQRDIKVYFSNPRYGGSKIKKIYYPLQANDAVILFQDGKANPKIFQQDHVLRGRDIKVRPLQRQVFSKVTVELCPTMTELLDNDPKYLDDIQYDGELDVTSEDNYTISGDWYQIEWAWQYLDDVCSQGGEVKPILLNREESQERVFNTEEDRSLEASGGTLNEILNPLQYPYHTESREADQFQQYSYERWRDAEPAGFDHNALSFGDADDLLGGLGMCGTGLGSAPAWLRNMPKRPPQSGFSLSHNDFKDVPLTFDFNISTLAISVLMNDILKEKTDAIVTSATSKLSHNYGLSRIIANLADQKLKTECKEYIEQHGQLNLGEVIHTSAGGGLDKKVGFVIHAVGPLWREDNKDESTHLLTCTYVNVFQYANSLMWLKSIAMPLIGTGGVGFPLDVCVQAFYDALLLYVMTPDSMKHLKEIRLVSNEADSTCSTIVVLRSLLDVDQISTQVAARDRYLNGCEKFGHSAKNLVLIGENSGHDAVFERERDDNKSRDEKESINICETKAADHDGDDEVKILPSVSKSMIKASETISSKHHIETEKQKSVSKGRSTLTNVDNTDDSSDESIPFGLVESDDEDVLKPIKSNGAASISENRRSPILGKEASPLTTAKHVDEVVAFSSSDVTCADNESPLPESHDSMVGITEDKYEGIITEVNPVNQETEESQVKFEGVKLEVSERNSKFSHVGSEEKVFSLDENYASSSDRMEESTRKDKQNSDDDDTNKDVEPIDDIDDTVD